MVGKGAEHPRWKGGRRMQSGYIFVLKRDHPNCDQMGYVAEHRLVMEKKLGRYLTPSELVHHINEIKDDNREENLELTNISKHMKGHSTTHGLSKTKAYVREKLRDWASKNKEKRKLYMKNYWRKKNGK